MWFRKRPSQPPNFAPRAYASLKTRVDAALAKLEDGEALPKRLFTSSVWSKHKGAFELANGRAKCAFCERYRDLSRECQLDHFRPRTAASTFASTPNYSAERPTIRREGVGYWWLAYTWSNLVLVCPGCNGAKGSLFPVEKRCAMDEGASTDDEQPMLLDPHDETLGNAVHFRWTVSGMIEPVTRGSRAEWTIVICDLNRDGLTHDRAKHFDAARVAFEAYKKALIDAQVSAANNGGVVERYRDHRLTVREADLRSVGSEDRECTALVRSCVDAWLRDERLPAFVW